MVGSTIELFDAFWAHRFRDSEHPVVRKAIIQRSMPSSSFYVFHSGPGNKKRKRPQHQYHAFLRDVKHEAEEHSMQREF